MRQPAEPEATPISAEFAAATLAEHYGLRGRLDALPGEHDANFKVTAPDGRLYLFKLHAGALDPSEAALQAATLRYLEANAAELPIQRLFLDVKGAVTPVAVAPCGGLHRHRLTTYLEVEI